MEQRGVWIHRPSDGGRIGRACGCGVRRRRRKFLAWAAGWVVVPFACAGDVGPEPVGECVQGAGAVATGLLSLQSSWSPWLCQNRHPVTLDEERCPGAEGLASGCVVQAL